MLSISVNNEPCCLGSIRVVLWASCFSCLVLSDPWRRSIRSCQVLVAETWHECREMKWEALRAAQTWGSAFVLRDGARTDVSGGKSEDSLDIWEEMLETHNNIIHPGLKSNLAATDKTRLQHDGMKLHFVTTRTERIQRRANTDEFPRGLHRWPNENNDLMQHFSRRQIHKTAWVHAHGQGETHCVCVVKINAAGGWAEEHGR